MPLNVNYVVVQDCCDTLVDIFHSLSEEEQEKLADTLEELCDKFKDKINENEEE